jgi:hypothetical protein
MQESEKEWQQSNLQVFWGEVAPFDHLVQFYESEEIFMRTLEGFVGSGFIAGDSVIIIANAAHLQELNSCLRNHGFDLAQLAAAHQYIALDAHETLARFMVNGWPDEDRFNQTISGVIGLAKHKGRRIRAFGEMVAELWQEGHHGATVQLEHLWNQFAKTERFCLFCAYPKSGFTQDPSESIDAICTCHSKLVGGWNKSATEIYYKSSTPV